MVKTPYHCRYTIQDEEVVLAIQRIVEYTTLLASAGDGIVRHEIADWCHTVDHIQHELLYDAFLKAIVPVRIVEGKVLRFRSAALVITARRLDLFGGCQSHCYLHTIRDP